MKSCTSDLNLSINNPFLILSYSKHTFKYSNLKIIVRIGVGRKGFVCTPVVYFWPCQRMSYCLNKSPKQVSCNAKLNKLQEPVGHGSNRSTQ